MVRMVLMPFLMIAGAYPSPDNDISKPELVSSSSSSGNSNRGNILRSAFARMRQAASSVGIAGPYHQRPNSQSAFTTSASASISCSPNSAAGSPSHLLQDPSSRHQQKSRGLRVGV